MTTQTKDRWKVEKSQDDDGDTVYDIRIDGGKMSGYFVATTNLGDDDDKGRAHLIAAAPDLAEAADAPDLDAAHERLSDLLESPEASVPAIREAAVALCIELNEHHERRKAALAKAAAYA